MKKSSKIAALELALILEKFTEVELSEAISWLKCEGYPIQFLAKNFATGKTKTVNKPKAKPIEETVSQAVIKLRGEDERKYRVLRSFDEFIRSGKVLSQNSQLRSFGQALSKDFVPRKTKRENISSIANFLSKLEFDAMKDAIQSVEKFEKDNAKSDYEELARFIMREGNSK